MTDKAELYEDALEAVDQLRDDLEAISNSDLPFSHNAEKIIEALEQAEGTK